MSVGRMGWFTLLGLVATATVVGATPATRSMKLPAAKPVAPEPQPVVGKIVKTPTGLKYIEEQLGNGNRRAKMGSRVTVHYTGWLRNGKKFDSSVDRGVPFEFILGVREVIPGWDEGITGMRQGGRRKLIIPPRLAYGSSSVGDGLIPPNSELIFDVELVDLR